MATCPIFPLAEFEAVNPAFARKGRWNEVLKGRIEGSCCSSDRPGGQPAGCCGFPRNYSLPYDYLTDHIAFLGVRGGSSHPSWSISRKPSRFMRVGLPSTIPQFR